MEMAPWVEKATLSMGVAACQWYAKSVEYHGWWRRGWQLDANKIFSAKSFILQVVSSNQNTSLANLTAVVWASVVHPKAEILVWLLMLGKLNTKGRLRKLNIIRDDYVMCPLCNCQQEMISHLFFACNHTWKIWCSCFSWWGYSWCYHNQPRQFLDQWLGIKLHGFQKKVMDLIVFCCGVVNMVWEKSGCLLEQDYKLGECKLFDKIETGLLGKRMVPWNSMRSRDLCSLFGRGKNTGEKEMMLDRGLQWFISMLRWKWYLQT